MSSASTVFISYSRADRKFASELANQLQNINDIHVLLNRDSVELGAPYDEQIATAMRHARVIIVLLSKHLKDSQFVHHEVTTALKSSSDRTIIPVLLDEEARDNLVWPLVADRVPIGPDVRGVRAAVESALGGPPHQRRSRRARWSRLIGLIVVAILVTGMITWLIVLSRSREVFKVSFSVEGGAHRGQTPQVGDIMTVSATDADLLLVYRNNQLELQCPGAIICSEAEHGWTVHLRLPAPGTYRILYAAGVGSIILTRSLDQDLLVLDKTARDLGSLPALVVY